EWSQLLAVAAALEPRVIVEWGSGGSTLALLRALPSLERLVSVEHNEPWYRRVRDWPTTSSFPDA
ncbi:MAG: hypothetical protein NZ898_05670, partial [Myxococcota bacterium]|nr:hypothetical protein [Myxococcota bacterium]